MRVFGALVALILPYGLAEGSDVVALVALGVIVLPRLISTPLPGWADALRVGLCLLAAGVALRWRSGIGAGEMLDFARSEMLPFAGMGALGWWFLTGADRSFGFGQREGRKALVMATSLALVLAFLTYEPIEQQGFAVVLGFATVAAAAHLAMMLVAGRVRNSAAGIWAIWLVEAVGYATLVMLIAVIRPEATKGWLITAALTVTGMFLIHAPFSRGFRRR
ncbi:MAG: hypothetical protein KBF27_06860 [Cypionkella sp.]|nr:hypothetical protein [Cypionkella sp.]